LGDYHGRFELRTGWDFAKSVDVDPGADAFEELREEWA
jgi:hypothetical protein